MTCVYEPLKAKVIWQKATSLHASVICKRNLVDIFNHIRQVAAHVAKLVLGVHLRLSFLGKECWFPIGSPL